MKSTIVKHWQEKVVYGAEGPQPQTLIATEKLKSVLVGLGAGQKIPQHSAPAAVYYFLEGSGQMIIGDEHIAVQSGTTIAVPADVSRGIEAETKLAFLGTHSGKE